MGDVTTNYKVNVGVEDAKWQAFVKSVVDLHTAYGGATKAAIEAAQKISASAEQSAAKQTASAKKVEDYLFKLRTNSIQLANKAADAEIKAAERAEKAEIAAAQKAADAIEAQQKKINAKYTSEVTKKEESERKAYQKLEQAAQKQAENEIKWAKKAADADAKERMKAANARAKFAQQAEKEAQKVAESEIKAAQKAAAQIEKEEEKKQKYLLKLRMDSIKAANAAEAKAEKDRNKPKEHGGGIGIGGAIGIGAAIKGIEVLTEKSAEYSEAQAKLHAATGLQMKDAEEVGKIYNKTGEQTAVVMSKVKFATGAQGEELKKQTEAVLAYSIASGKSEEAVAKLMNTETGRAKIFADAKRNEAIAQEKANDPAMKAQFIQAQLMSTIGKVAATVMTALAPALNAVMPIIDAVGELVTSVVAPALDSLKPIMAIISKAFADLTPVIVQLVQVGVSLLQPIIESLAGVLGDLIPPIVEIIKQVADALMPVFKALAPVIKIIANIFAGELKTFIGVFITEMQTVFVPLLQNAVVPIMMSLIPLVQMIAEIFQDVMVPALKLLGGIFDWLMKNIVQPMIKYFSGIFVTVINKAVEIVKDVIGAIKKVADAVGSVISFFGGGSDEAAKGGKEVAKSAGEAASKEAARQAEIEKGNEDKRQRLTLGEKLKHGKISAAEEATLREQAQEEGDQAMIAKLDAFDKKKESQAASAGKKAKKSAVDSAKEQADAVLAITKEEIAAEDITDREAKAKTRTAELTHAQAILDIFKTGTKEYTAAKLKLQQLKNADAKEDRADRIADAKKTTEDQLAELEIRATKENMSAKALKNQQYKIELEGVEAEIALVKKGSDEEAKLLQQRALMVVKHSLDSRKDVLTIQNETNKLVLDNQKEFLTLQIQQLKVLGKNTLQAELESFDLEAKEEDNRYGDELEKRKEQGDALVDADGKINALGLALQIEHQQKLAAITAKGHNARIESMKKEAEFFAGPIAAGFTNTFHKLMKGADDWTAKMAASNNVLESIFGGILQGFVQMIEGMIEKIIAIEAVVAVADLIPGFSGLMEAIGGIGSLIPHADGGIISHAEGGVGVQPVRLGRHQFFEAGPEAVIPLSSGRAQGMMQSAFGFDRALAPVVAGLSKIETHVARPKTVLPMNDGFENARNNYIKSEDRRSI